MIFMIHTSFPGKQTTALLYLHWNKHRTQQEWIWVQNCRNHRSAEGFAANDSSEASQSQKNQYLPLWSIWQNSDKQILHIPSEICLLLRTHETRREEYYEISSIAVIANVEAHPPEKATTIFEKRGTFNLAIWDRKYFLTDSQKHFLQAKWCLVFTNTTFD